MTGVQTCALPICPILLHHGRGLCVASVPCYPFFFPVSPPPSSSSPSANPLSLSTARRVSPNSRPAGARVHEEGPLSPPAAPPMRLAAAAPCNPRRPLCLRRRWSARARAGPCGRGAAELGGPTNAACSPAPGTLHARSPARLPAPRSAPPVATLKP